MTFDIVNPYTDEILCTIGDPNIVPPSNSGFRFHNVNLARCDLTDANLNNQTFAHSTFVGATLKTALMAGATFFRSDLTGADLSGAGIFGSRFKCTKLSGANFAGAHLEDASFVDCTDLHEAVGLNAIRHRGPCSLNRITLTSSIEHLPDVFLEGCGYTREEIGVLRALYVNSPIQFFSCFISHADKKPDSDFAERLYNDLRAVNVTCWHFQHDLLMGTRWAPQIEGAIKSHDKLVVVCSEEGTLREGVIREIIRAVELETKTGEQKLFPVRLDDFIFSKEATDKFQALPPAQRRADWLEYMREYQIGDFTKWKRHDVYRTQFERLLGG